MFLLVQDGTLRGNEWQNNAACCHAVCMSIRDDQMFCCIYATHLGYNSSSLMWPHGLDLTFTGNGVSRDLLSVVPFFCLFIPSLSLLPHCMQVFICLLQPAYRLLYYSWAPYCFFGWCRMHVFICNITYNLHWPHLQFTRAKLQDHSWWLHLFLMFAPISSRLLLVYNQINVEAVLNKTVNHTWAQSSDTQRFHI